MNEQEIIDKTVKMIKNSSGGAGHDWFHVERVWKNALNIGKSEIADMFIVQLGALLHDIADWKFSDDDLSAGAKASREWLQSLNIEESIIQKVEHIVEHVSYKGALVENKMNSIEGFIVQDADRLDAIGAIGIARTFTYGGSQGRTVYDPNKVPELHKSFEDYKKTKSESSTIAHFYEKLLLLKDMMNTKTGKKLAENRHKFMEKYLEEFYAEWNGEN